MRLCLNMIVRDEAPNIRVSLESLTAALRPDTWVIHDTGSRDDTRAIIVEFFSQMGIPGRLEHRPWTDFGSNRQQALEDATGLSDWLLFFDADNLIEGRLPPLPAGGDAITLNMRRGGADYPAKLIVRNDGSYRWRGVVHEGLYHRGGVEDLRHLAGDYHIDSRSAGNRSRDGATYYRDARALEQAVANLAEADMDLLPRYTFYCANSWRDAGAPREAAFWYRRRIALGGWRDEVYLSWLGLGLALNASGDPLGAAEAFRAGYEHCPERAECLYHLARHEREQGRPNLALSLAAAGLALPPPDSGRLFVWRDIHDHWMDFEYLLCLKALGRLQDGTAALGRLARSRAPRHLYHLLDLAPPEVSA